MKKTIVFLNIVALITGFAIVFCVLSVDASDLQIPSNILVRVTAVGSSSLDNITSQCSINGNSIQFFANNNLYNRFIITLYFDNLSVYNLTDTSSFNFTSITSFRSFANINGVINYSPYYYSSSINYTYPNNGSLSALQYDVNTAGSQTYTGFIFTFSCTYTDETGALISSIDSKLEGISEDTSAISGKLDQTNSLLEEGLTFVPSSSIINQESGDLGGSLLDDLGSGASDINAAIDDHIPDVSSWLANNPQIYQDMLNISGLANYVMLGVAHSDPSIFIYLSLMAFVSLLMVIEVNLKRGPTSFHIHQVAQRHYVNNQRSSHHFGFN